MFKGNYIHGSFVKSEETAGAKRLFAPGDLSKELGSWSYSVKDIDKAVSSGKQSFPGWKKKSLAEKSACFQKLISILADQKKQIVLDLALQTGRAMTSVDFEIEKTILSMKKILDLQYTPNEKVIHEPLGVIAIISSFSEPLLHPILHGMTALLAGNTVILKSSEKTPLSGQLLFDLIDLAGFEPGVWNGIHGDREIGRRLAVHECVDGICFVGGYESGIRIKQDILQQNWKHLSMWMGGKNLLIVDESANLDAAVQLAVKGAFDSSGQVYDSTSRVLVHRKLAEAYLEKLHQEAKKIKIGDPLDPTTEMGPLIDDGAMDRYIKFQGIALREGAEIVMRGKTLDISKKGYYVSPSIAWVKNNDHDYNKKSVYLQTEILGPNIAFQSFDQIEEAISIANNNQYPQSVSVATADMKLFDLFRSQLQYPRVNKNAPTTQFDISAPVTAIRKSGNRAHLGPFGFLNYTYSKVTL